MKYLTIFITFFLLGCLDPETDAKLSNADLIGSWEIDSNNLKSTHFSKESTKKFRLNIKKDGSLIATNVPPGILWNEAFNDTTLTGSWKHFYNDGFNYISFDYDGGVIGCTIQWKNGVMLIRLNNDDFVYLSRIK